MVIQNHPKLGFSDSLSHISVNPPQKIICSYVHIFKAADIHMPTASPQTTSRWDRYLGITAPMTQVPVPTATISPNNQ